MRRRFRNQNNLSYYELRTVSLIPLFTSKWNLNKLCSGLKWCCEKRGLRIYEYVILTDRILLIVNAAWGHLPDTINSYKNFTSKALIRNLREGSRNLDRSWIFPALKEASAGTGNEVSIWSDEMIVRSLYSADQIDEHAIAIRNSPVKAGLVAKPEDYLFCSANPRNPLEGWQVAVTDRGI